MQTAAQSTTTRTAFTAALLAAYKEHQAGWDAYEAGESFCVCRNAQAQAGWMSALRAESVASLPAACADHLGF